MKCPNCDQPNYYPSKPCPECKFSGDALLVEDLSHVDWFLEELKTWSEFDLPALTQQRIEQKYTYRQQELEVVLKLRLPPFTEAEAREAWPKLFQRELLLKKMVEWHQANLLKPALVQALADRVQQQINELQERLVNQSPPPTPDPALPEMQQFLKESIAYLAKSQAFTSVAAEGQVMASLLTPEERAKIGSAIQAQTAKPAIETSEVFKTSEVSPPISQPVAKPVTPQPKPTPPPAMPLRERFMRTLLSERTLHAMLFLGIFLIFSAAISFVIWGWQDFSPLLRVMIPTGFTALFFGLGELVRTKTPLHRSGIALSAIGSLLIPIDFYTVYINFNIPLDYRPEFWFITSVACLLAYIVITLTIQSRFFGYLVAAAAGSTVLSLIEIGQQLFGLSLDWRTASLSALSLGLIIVATALGNLPQINRWHVLAEPFRYISLLTVGVLMPFTFGVRLNRPPAYDAFHYAVTLNWWFGGFIFGWGAVYHRSRFLGNLAAIALPFAVYLGQAALLFYGNLSLAWHAFGLACLVPLYLIVGYRLSRYEDDPLLLAHSRTAINWGAILLVVAAVWPLTNLSQAQLAIACTHTVLMGAVIMATFLWQRPNYLYGVSLLSLSAVSFAMLKFELSFAQLSVGWASLAIAHVIMTMIKGLTGLTGVTETWSTPLVEAGYGIATLSIFAPLISLDKNLLTYTLGNWLGLTAWGAILAHRQYPGFVNFPRKWSLKKTSQVLETCEVSSTFHWLTAVFLPLWIFVIFMRWQWTETTLALTLTVLAWGMVLLSYRLSRLNQAYRAPWHLMGILVSLGALTITWQSTSDFTLSVIFLMIGLLYFTDALTQKHSRELMPAGLITAWGYVVLLKELHFSLHFSYDAIPFALSLLIACYINLEFGLSVFPQPKIKNLKSNINFHPLYLTAHVLTMFTLGQIYMSILFDFWTDEMRAWGAATQLVLSVVYMIYAWHTSRSHWAHLATWLLAASGGFVAIIFSSGHGASAAESALLAMAYVLTERFLHFRFLILDKLALRFPQLQPTKVSSSKIEQVYSRALLTTGWTISVFSIVLALGRNLFILGGRTPQIWAVLGLLLVTGLYAMSARLFHRVKFVWLAALLVFAPWTIATNLLWPYHYYEATSQFPISWVMLAWLLFLTHLGVRRIAPPTYARPLKIVAHGLLIITLLSSISNINTGCIVFGLAVGLYIASAWLDYTLLRAEILSISRATSFLYPSFGLTFFWCVYLLTWLFPHVRLEHYGLLFLFLAPWGIGAGRWLQRQVRDLGSVTTEVDYAMPAYWISYGAVIFGTMFVLHINALFILALLFDTGILITSAWLFQNPLWLYLAVVLVPGALLLALNETTIATSRYGWWLIALSADYLALTWALRRANLARYSHSLLIASFLLMALGLPPSNLDQNGALVGYSSVVLLCVITAFWLKQVVLLYPACALSLVPYAIILEKSALPPDYYGLAIFPFAIAALGAGVWFDPQISVWQKIQSSIPNPQNPQSQIPNPLYLLGFGLTLVAPLFTAGRSGLTAFNFLLQMPIFGWAIYHFRYRIWLLATGIAGHLAVVYSFNAFGWWTHEYVWVYFLPVTVLTTGLALFIEQRLGEVPPLPNNQWSTLEVPWAILSGWSRPLYVLALFDVAISQWSGLLMGSSATAVTFVHALLIAGLASRWLSLRLIYLSLILATVIPFQWLMEPGMVLTRLPVSWAQLAFGYGAVGYGLTLLIARQKLPNQLAMWERPLQQFGLGLSGVILVILSPSGLALTFMTLGKLLGR